MNSSIRVAIEDMIFYLDDSRLLIYEDESETVIEHKSKIYRSNKINCISRSKNTYPPLYIEHIGNEINIFLNKSKDFDLYAYSGDKILSDGTNCVDIPENKNKLIIGMPDKNLKQSIYIEKIKENEDTNEKEFKNDLLRPFSNKNFGNSYNSEINEQKRIINILEKNNKFDFVAKGGGRNVYKIKDKSSYDFINKYDGSIVKVASMKNTIKRNRSEAQTWQAVKDTKIRKFFCPITNIGPEHKYIIMKEAQQLKDSDNKDHIVKEIEESIAKHVNLPENVEYDKFESMVSYKYDITKDNIGIYKNQPVLIDYPFGALVEII